MKPNFASFAVSSPNGRFGVRSRLKRRRSSSIASSRISLTLRRPSNELGFLCSSRPDFSIARPARGRPDSYDVASRLSFGLWDSLPDEVLLKAAASGQLVTRAQVAGQAERMVKDPRALAKLEGFFLQWLKIDQAREIVKDPKRYPEFDENVVSDLRTSLDLLLDDVLGSDASDYRQLLLAKHVYLNGRLAQLYGAKLPADAPFQKSFARARRACSVC